jgi:hypothetical protein
MKIYAVRYLLNNIVLEIKERNIISKSLDKLRFYIKDKIDSYILYFCENNFRPDGFRIKHIENNIFEMRIILSSKWLLRIFFLKENDLFLLFGIYLVKPRDYDDRYIKAKISNEYKKEIENLKRIYKDFI